MLSECAYDCTEMKNGDSLTNRVFRCKTYSSCNCEPQNRLNLGFENECLDLSYSNIHSLAMMSFSNIEFPLFLCR